MPGSGEKILIKALKGGKTERPPFWFMRQAGRYLPEYRELRSQMGDFWDLVFTPEKASLVTLQPVERFSVDGAILFSDILVIPHALGQKVSFVQGTGPVLEPINFTAGKFGLESGHIIERLAPIFKTLEITKKNLPEGVALIGFAGSPWTVATYMIESKGTPEKIRTLIFARENPEKFQTLIDLLITSTIQYLEGQIEAGAEALQLFDSWAGAIKNEKSFRRWVIGPTKKIVTSLKQSHPNIPIIGFPKGAGKFYKPYFQETGLNALNIDYDVDPKWAARELQSIGCIQGNLDPRFLVSGGDEMMIQVKNILEVFKGGPHVFNLGHGIVPETPLENVAEVSAFLKSLA